VAARPLHAPPPLAARGFTHRHQKSKQTGRGGLQQPPPLFLSLPAVGNAVTCKTPRNANSKVSGSVSLLQIFSLLSSPFGFLFFPSSGGGRL